MSATLKSWLQGRHSMDAGPPKPSRDSRSLHVGENNLGRTHSFNDFSCSAADDAQRTFANDDRECKCDRFRSRASAGADPTDITAAPPADWLQFRRLPLSRASCNAAITSPMRIQPRDSVASSVGGSVQSEDGAPETPNASSGWQRKSDSVEHWEWSQLMHGSSL